jgi:hypothetical protein
VFDRRYPRFIDATQRRAFAGLGFLIAVLGATLFGLAHVGLLAGVAEQA